MSDSRSRSARSALVLVAAGILLVIGAAWLLLEDNARTRGERVDRDTLPYKAVRGSSEAVASRRTEDLPQPNSPANPAEASSPVLPDAYQGQEAIRGIVTEGGIGCRATVRCTPVGYAPRNEVESSALLTESNEQGHFEFRRFPKARSYRMEAVSASGAIVSRVARIDTLVTLRIQRLEYERLEFVDENGEPVDLSGRNAVFACGATIRRSALEVIRDHCRLTGKALDIRRNDGVAVYMPLGPGVPALLGEAEREIRVGGYETVRGVAVNALPMSKWPSVTTVVPLTRDEKAKQYVFKFPSPAAPAEWSDHQFDVPELSLIARIRDRSYQVSPSRNSFWERPGTLVLQHWPDIAIPHTETETADGTIQISPREAAVAFVSFRYPTRRMDHPNADAIPMLATKQGMMLRLVVVYPGLARAVVPAGEYRAGLGWSDGTQEEWSRFKRVEAKEGAAEIDLR